MGLKYLLVLLYLLKVSESLPTIHPINSTELAEAIADMISKSYNGFAILLRMLNGMLQPIRNMTFLMPNNTELSAPSISPDHLEEFILSHTIPMLLHFSDLPRFPTGTFVPSGEESKMIRVQNHGTGDLFVNNAKIVSGNVCLGSVIKCHGIDQVIQYDT